MKKILIAGTNSGVGKTTISLGIMQALTKRNLKVQPYKVGPDYIDPSYHTFITKRNSRNLDSYMLDDEKIKYIVKNASKDADISVIEGVMGLYDGYGIDYCRGPKPGDAYGIGVTIGTGKGFGGYIGHDEYEYKKGFNW